MSEEADCIPVVGPRYKLSILTLGDPGVGIAFGNHSHVELLGRQTGHDFFYRKILRIRIAFVRIGRCENRNRSSWRLCSHRGVCPRVGALCATFGCLPCQTALTCWRPRRILSKKQICQLIGIHPFLRSACG
jgi:hypothetical protein